MKDGVREERKKRFPYGSIVRELIAELSYLLLMPLITSTPDVLPNLKYCKNILYLQNHNIFLLCKHCKNAPCFFSFLSQPPICIWRKNTLRIRQEMSEIIFPLYKFIIYGSTLDFIYQRKLRIIIPSASIVVWN